VRSSRLTWSKPRKVMDSLGRYTSFRSGCRRIRSMSEYGGILLANSPGER
jgi:hypothetical protein